MPNIGPWELVILVVVLLLVFGAKRLPEIGKSMGKGMREFKDSVTGKDDAEELPPAADAQRLDEAPTEITATAVEEDESVSVGDRNRPE